MKRWQHLAIVLAAGLAFHGAASAWGATIGPPFAWYHEPLLLPMRAALWAGGNAHDPNAAAGNIVWALECLLVGLLCDGGVVGLMRVKRRSRVSTTSQ